MTRHDGNISEKSNWITNTRGAARLVIVIALLFIVTLAGLLLLFNVGGIRDAAVALLFPSEADSDLQSGEDGEIQEQLKAIENEKNRLRLWESQLNALKEELEGKQQELEQLEMELEQKAREAEELQQELTGQLKTLKDIAKVYENMETEQAASILSEMEDTVLVIRILKNLPSERSAEILGAMDPKKAAELTRQMAGQ